MARAFGHEVAEVAHDLAPDLFVGVVARLLEIALEGRVKVLALMFELQEPSHVVDAGGEKIDLVLGHAHVA